MGCSRKIQARGIEDIYKKKKKKILNLWSLSLYPWQSRQNKAFFTLGNSVKLCNTFWKFQGQKPRFMRMQHDFFFFFWSSIKIQLFYPWIFWTRSSFTLGNTVKLCYTLWPPLKIALLFQLIPRISSWYFFNTPENSMS